MTFERISRRILVPLALILWVLLAIPLSGCTAEVEAEASRGGITPTDVVESFIESLNKALADPSLGNPGTRSRWAEQLASYFAPSERRDQRVAMNTMLAGFADSASRAVVGTRVSMIISFTRAEVASSTDNEAIVRLVDGVITLRWLDENGEVLRERTGSLMDVIGGGAEGLPVLRVDGLWFMTEG